jgi:hypothetical protein
VVVAEERFDEDSADRKPLATYAGERKVGRRQ